MASHFLAPPHIFCEDSTRKMMARVFFVLTPVFLWAGFLYGIRVFLMLACNLFFSVFFDVLVKIVHKKTLAFQDVSSVVTSALFTLNLSVLTPFWMLPILSFLSVVIAKNLFGGLGKNIWNPAAFALSFCFLVFPGQMNAVISPEKISSFWKVSFLEEGKEAAEGALAEGALGDWLLGAMPAAMGTGAALLLLMAFLVLAMKRIVSPGISVAYLSIFALLALCFPAAGQERVSFSMISLVSANVLLPAFFMATDPVTSPTLKSARWIFGLLCGSAHFFFYRYWGTLAAPFLGILAANTLSRPLDLLFRPTPYGYKRVWLKKTEGKFRLFSFEIKSDTK